MTIPACQPIQDQINNLKVERADLQADLQDAPPNQKAGLAAQIKAINAQITQKQIALQKCEIDHGVPQPITVTLSGNGALSTNNEQAKGPFPFTISIGMRFSGDRTTVIITSFPPVQTPPFSTPLGQNVTTISPTSLGTGSFIKATGSLSLPLSLFFDQSIDIPIVVEDSDLALVLTTGTAKSPTGAFTLSGSPLNSQTKAITLVAASQFKHGFLDGSDCSLTIAGTLSALP